VPDVAVLRITVLTSLTLAAMQTTIAAAPPEHVVGVYSKSVPHCDFDADGRPIRCEGVIRDRLTITRKKNQPHIDLRLGGQVGHACSLSARGKWIDSRLVAESKASTNPGKVCRLEITFDENTATLHDADQSCYEMYCSARGRIDNVSLPRLRTKRLHKKAR